MALVMLRRNIVTGDYDCIECNQPLCSCPNTRAKIVSTCLK